MSQVKSIQVGNTTYNVVQASAKAQKKLMTLIGGKITLNSALSGSQIDIPMLKGALVTSSEQLLDEVAEIVLWKTVISGGDKLVTIDNFQGGMNDYFTLLAEAINFNLADFFIWLDVVNAENRKPRPEVTPAP